MSTLLRRQFTAFFLIVTLFVTMIGVVNAAAVAPPNILSYQGRILNAAGVPVSDASVSVKFKLYNDPTAGSCLWSNSSSSCATSVARTVTLSSGLFSENLGDTGVSYAAILDTVFSDNSAVYLGITIGSDTEMTPRKRMTSAPYALNAQTLDGIDSTSFVRNDSAVLGASPLSFEGATTNDFQTGFSFTDPTADRTITFQNADGTVAFLSDLGVTADSLNFTDFVDAMTLDAATTISGNILSLNTNSNFAVNINTGTSTGALSLGGGSGTVAINSSDWDIDTTGAMTGIGSITSDGTISASDFSCTDCLDFAEFSDSMTLDATTTIAGAALSLNTDSNFAVNINTGTSTGALSLGGGSGTVTIDSTKWDVSSSGDMTTAFTLLDGSSTASGIGTNSTSLTLSDATNFDIGNYVYVNSTYAKITNKVAMVLTITPALTWGAADPVTEYHIPEVGGTNLTNTLANRYGMGYFIGGIAAGNGSTYYSDKEITAAASSTFNFVNDATTLNVGSTAVARTINIGTGTSTDYINIGTENTSQSRIVIGNSELTSYVTLDSGSTSGGLFMNERGAVTKTYIGSNSTDGASTVQIATNATTADTITIGNNNAATFTRLEGAYLYLNNTTGTNEIDLGGNGGNSATDTINIATNGTLADVISIGNTHASTTIALTTGSWGISTTGALTGIASIATADNQTSLLSNINVTGADVLAHTYSFSIDSDPMLLISASGNGAGGITGRQIALGTTSVDAINIATDATASDTITIGNSSVATSVTLNAGSSGIYINERAATTNTYIGSNSTDGASTVQIATNATTADTITIGNNNAATFTRLEGAYLYLNNTTGTNEIDLGGNGGNSATDTINIATNGTLADVISIGNTHASTTIALTTGDWGISTAGALTGINSLAGSDNQASIIRNIEVTGTNATAHSHVFSIDSTPIMLVSGGGDGAGGISYGQVQMGTTITDYIDISTSAAAADTITIGNTNSGTTTSLIGGNASLIDFADFDVAATGATTIVPDSNVTALTLTGTNVTSGTLLSLSAAALTNGKALSVTATNTYTVAGPPFISSVLVDLTNAQTTNAGSYIGSQFKFTNNPGIAGNTEYAMVISNEPTSNTTDNATAALLYVSNNDTTTSGTTVVTDAIRVVVGGASPIADGIVDGIDVSDTNITNAINIGANAIAGTNFSVLTTGATDLEVSLTIDAPATASTQRLCASSGGGNALALNDVIIVDCSDAGQADYAEIYPVATDVAYGDIVVPGSKKVITTHGDEIVELVKSSSPYAGPVSGIVRPDLQDDMTVVGYNIHSSDNPKPVALVGRIPVNVTNENGPIHVGDFVTTSSTPGKGMKATAAGRIIGMALADFDGTTGQVMVQVNNSWYFGSLIGNDGTSTVLTDNVIVAPVGKATASTISFDSYGLMLRGSAWNGNEAQAVSMMFKNTVTDGSNYRLSVRNTTDSEVAYITNTGTMQIAGDMVVGGKIYPSNLGGIQKDKYIYYDGSEGPGGDFMRTNASGWSTGSYDFAEMFPSTEALVSGDVVVFAETNENVKRSTKKDEKSIAGIVSTRPGFLAGENTPGSFPIALAGRVPTNVNTENGPISVGDPLTTSSTAGFAMKATTPGPIVGYALEPLNATQGKIIVFVSAGYWGGEATSETPGTDNRASLFGSSGSSMMTALSMSGNINMNGNEISNIGRMAGLTNAWMIELDGTIKTEALLKTVITGQNNQKVETAAVTSPEAVITLSGSSVLKDGQAEVRFFDINKDFGNVISAVAPIRVVATPNGPVSLYVFEKDQNHFIVKSFGGNASDVEFDWVVTGYRKGYEPVVEPVVAPATSSSTSSTPVESIPTELTVQATTETPSVTPTSDVPASSTSSSTTIVDPSMTDAGAIAPTPSP